MKFYAPSFLLQSYTLLEALGQIEKLGFCGSEIWYEHLGENPPKRKILKSLPLEFSLHAPSWDINPASRIKTVRDFAAKLILKSLDFAAAIEARTVVIHPGHKSNPQNDFRMYEEILHDFLGKIISRGEELGLVIAMEIMDATPNQLVNTPQTANRFTDLFPTLTVCFDVANGRLNVKEILTYIEQHYPAAVVAVEGYEPAGELALVKKNLAYLRSINFWP